jgi:hypothetical protein
LSQAGRQSALKTASSATAAVYGQKSQKAQYVAEIKKSLNPGIFVAHQIFNAAEAHLKMCVHRCFQNFLPKLNIPAVFWKKCARMSANSL